MSQEVTKKQLWALGPLWLLVNGVQLFYADAIYWDDWIIFGVDPAHVLKTFAMAGTPFSWVAHLHFLLLKAGPWLYRWLVFTMMSAAGFFVYKVLQRDFKIDRQSSLLISFMFLVLPFNSARIALINIPYAIAYFSFFLAWYLLPSCRWVALLLFFFSFSTNSLLVFFALPVAALFLASNPLPSPPSKILRWAVRNCDLLLLPFLFWYIKTQFFPPQGLYAGYNQNFSPVNLVNGLLTTVASFSRVEANLPLTVFFLIPLLALLPKSFVSSYPSKKGIIVAVIVIAAALFPYLVLGHPATFEEWTNRHQLLLPLGFSLLIFFAIQRWGGQWSGALLALCLSVSLSLTLETNLDFLMDWRKQREIIRLLAKSDEVRRSNLIVFEDHAAGHNAIQRTLRFYEWSGLLKAAFKDETRLGINWHERGQVSSGAYLKYRDHGYNFGAFDHSSIRALRVSIRPKLKLSRLERLLPVFSRGRVYQLEISELPFALAPKA